MTEIYKALSDENRLRIINALFRKELCVCCLEKILGANQSNVSRHLNKLKYAGIILNRKSSQWVYYYMNPKFIDDNNMLIKYLKTQFNSEIYLKDMQKLMELENIEECQLNTAN